MSTERKRVVLMHRSSRVAFMLFSVRAAGRIVSVEVPGLADYIPVGADS